jgi:hypothetical protein
MISIFICVAKTTRQLQSHTSKPAAAMALREKTKSRPGP